MTLQLPPMVYVQGEEMTRVAMDMILDSWFAPHTDMSAWEVFDLSAKHRDDTEDQVLHDVVAAGKRLKAIFKEPTVTPTEAQRKSMGLKKAWGSPNGAMRRGWNGISISRDTIQIPGIALGYKESVLFDRHAVGGEYGAAHALVGKGTLKSVFEPADGSEAVVIDARELTNAQNAAVSYINPLDNVDGLAHHFFRRALAAKKTPYIVTKKTVFKWQESFWQICKEVFNAHYKDDFAKAGLLKDTHGELAHLISDAATMKMVAWTDGNFAMVSHNYDGDMLTDLMSQVHRSPGFISSVLLGKDDNGNPIKEFEASHGTVANQYKDHLAGKETSLNPLGMVDALLGAINHAASFEGNAEAISAFTARVRAAMYDCMKEGKATRDMVGASGLTTEGFIAAVAERI